MYFAFEKVNIQSVLRVNCTIISELNIYLEYLSRTLSHLFVYTVDIQTIWVCVIYVK